MSIWDPYKLSELSEETRADVIKIHIQQTEETKRKKIGDGDHQIVRGIAVFLMAVVSIVGIITAYYASETWKEVRIKAIQAASPAPLVCPAAPPVVCPPFPPQGLDIHLSHLDAPSVSAPSSSK